MDSHVIHLFLSPNVRTASRHRLPKGERLLPSFPPISLPLRKERK